MSDKPLDARFASAWALPIWPLAQINPHGQGKNRQPNYGGRYYSAHDGLLARDAPAFSRRRSGLLIDCGICVYFLRVHLDPEFPDGSCSLEWRACGRISGSHPGSSMNYAAQTICAKRNSIHMGEG